MTSTPSLFPCCGDERRFGGRVARALRAAAPVLACALAGMPSSGAAQAAGSLAGYSGVVAPVTAPHADPARLAQAREVIGAMKLDRVYEGLGQQMQQMASMMARGAKPGDTDKHMAAIQMKIAALSIESKKELLDQLAGVYAETFSQEELEAMRAFYESPVGKTMVDKQPLVAQRIYPLISQAQRDLLPRIKKIVQDETGAAPQVVGAGPRVVAPAAAGAAAGPVAGAGAAAAPAPRPAPGAKAGFVPQP